MTSTPFNVWLRTVRFWIDTSGAVTTIPLARLTSPSMITLPRSVPLIVRPLVLTCTDSL